MKRLRTMLFMIAAFCHLSSASVEAQAALRIGADSAYASLILDEWAQHPLMEQRDLYKFVYQSAMGPGHSVRDTTAVRNWMQHEIVTLDMSAAHDEPTVELLRPDSALVRVNLRPFLAAGGDAESLLQAFIQTANSYDPSTDQLEHHWSIVTDLAHSGRLSFDADSLRDLFQTMEEAGFPAVHHSAAYTEAYHPAYRVAAYQKNFVTISSD